MDVSLEARALKCTVMLEPTALSGLVVPNGVAKVTLRVTLPGRIIKAEVNAKSLRRAVTAIEATGPENVAVILQGKLEGNGLIEAGISAQPKGPPKAAAA